MVLEKKTEHNDIKTSPTIREVSERINLTLQGRPLITRKPFLRMVPACWGYVREAPASALSKWTSCPW